MYNLQKSEEILFLRDLYSLTDLFNGGVDIPPCNSLEGKSSVHAIVHGNKLYIITSYFIVMMEQLQILWIYLLIIQDQSMTLQKLSHLCSFNFR